MAEFNRRRWKRRFRERRSICSVPVIVARLQVQVAGGVWYGNDVDSSPPLPTTAPNRYSPSNWRRVPVGGDERLPARQASARHRQTGFELSTDPQCIWHRSRTAIHMADEAFSVWRAEFGRENSMRSGGTHCWRSWHASVLPDAQLKRTVVYDIAAPQTSLNRAAGISRPNPTDRLRLTIETAMRSSRATVLPRSVHASADRSMARMAAVEAGLHYATVPSRSTPFPGI